MIVDAVVVDAETGDDSWTMEKLHRSHSRMVTMRAMVKLMMTIVELLVNDCAADSLKNSYTLLFLFSKF